jgi:DNA-binding transcriptional LysR family regulator
MAEANWDDLQLFYEVAREGGLTGAAARTGLSAATIGRRMLGLERTLGRTLFKRSQRGYALAHDGEVLFERVGAMQATARSISDWHQDAFSLPIVSIASDPWISPLMASQAFRIRQPDDQFRICCNTVRPGFDLTFRAADIAVLPERPQTGNFAVLRSVAVFYATYRSANCAKDDVVPWISIGTESAVSASDRWVFENHEPEIFTWTGDRFLLPGLIAAGAGQGVLPVFIGDADPRLQRTGSVIEELGHPLWIISNDDDRHRPEVRIVIDRVATILKDAIAAPERKHEP